LGHGLFGRISRRMKRDDTRLRDDEGCPFWDSTYAAAVARIQSRIRAGAGATVAENPDGFDLKICSGPTVWQYAIDAETLFFRAPSRAEGGTQVENTRYSDFRSNVGLEPRLFEF